MLLIKNDWHTLKILLYVPVRIIGNLEYRVYMRQKNGGCCHHLLSVYDASKLCTKYVVKSLVLGLQRAIFQKNQDFQM